MALSVPDRHILADIERHLVQQDPRLDRALRDFCPAGPLTRLRPPVWLLLTASVLLLLAAAAARSGPLLVPAAAFALLSAVPRVTRRPHG